MSADKTYQKRLQAYDDLVANFEHVERKGKSMPYTSVNGHMFSHLSKEGEMGLRLSQSDRDEFCEKYNSALFVQHGRTMKEFVAVPTDLVSQADMVSWFERSLAYTQGLRPKK